MRPYRMNALVKSYRRAFERFERHCSGNVGETNKLFSTMQCQRADSPHRLRPVKKCQAFFHFQLQRRNARAFESRGCGDTLALVKNFSFTDSCQCEVCEWRQVT